MLRKLVFILLTLFSATSIVAEDEGPFAFLEEKYRGLSTKGKFLATATVGFVGTRVAVNTAVGVIKVGAAAFITAEVLHHTGVMDNIPEMSDEQEDMLNAMKHSIIKKTNGFRVQVRRRLGSDAIKHAFDNEKIGALGLASGALVGTLL